MATNISMRLNATKSTTQNVRDAIANASNKSTIRGFLYDVGNSAGGGTLQYAILNNDSAAGSCTVTIAVNGSVAANDTVTVQGIVFTAKTSGATGAQFNIGGTATITAANLVAAINANATLSPYVSANNSAGVVTVTSLTTGPHANVFTIAVNVVTPGAITSTAWAGGASDSASFQTLIK